MTVQGEASLERTVLEGGVTVLSVDAPVADSTLSLFVQAGSRYEDRQTAGAASFLKYLAYTVPYILPLPASGRLCPAWPCVLLFILILKLYLYLKSDLSVDELGGGAHRWSTCSSSRCLDA